MSEVRRSGDCLRYNERESEYAKIRIMHRLPTDLGNRFGERIERQLREQPLEISPEEHRVRLAELMAQVGELNHYEFLGITPDASSDQVHDAYDRLARLVHPSHAPTLGLGGREAALELLFEEATHAYLVLSHPDRRREYDREAEVTKTVAVMARAGREEEARQVARRYYRQAISLGRSEEYHFALELLGEAVRIDPRPEYYCLLGEIELKNPRWTSRAFDSFQAALAAAPDDPRAHLGMARAHEALGRPLSAQEHYRKVLAIAPEAHEAREGLSRIEEGPAAPGGVGERPSRPRGRRLLRLLGLRGE